MPSSFTINQQACGAHAQLFTQRPPQCGQRQCLLGAQQRFTALTLAPTPTQWQGWAYLGSEQHLAQAHVRHTVHRRPLAQDGGQVGQLEGPPAVGTRGGGRMRAGVE